MAIYQGKPKRKISGGRYRNIEKRINRKGNLPAHTKIGEKFIKEKRSFGGNKKSSLVSIAKINVYNPKTKKCSIAEIKTVTENPANRHLVRRNVITKGSILTTNIGKVKVSSRPGQNGSLSGILVE